MLKRVFDILVSFFGLLATSPVLIPVIIIIWLQDFHSPFYIASRVGKYEKIFSMIKLRSMIVSADSSGVDSTSADDQRITTIGKIVRASKLDELKYSKTISRVVVVVALIAGVLIAFRAEGILYTMIIFNYPYMGSMLVPLLGGVLWERATPKGAIAAMFAGGVIGVASFFAGIPGRFHGLFNIDLGLFIAYTVSAVVFVAVSLITSDASLRFRSS